MNTYYPDAQGYGPALVWQQPRLRPYLKRFLQLLVIIVAIIALAVSGLIWQASSKIQRIPVQGLEPPDGSLNILLVGSDSRDDLTDDELIQMGTERVAGDRTDTIFLLSVKGGKAAVLSFPRDLWVTNCEGHQGRINATYHNGDPSCLIQTIKQNTGIPITHYVSVNIAGFIKVVDAAGGVPVWLDAPMQDKYANISLPAGCSFLDGKQASAFVRVRHIDSDLGRIDRQQRILKTLTSKVISPETMVNLPRLFKIAEAGGSSLTADQDLGVFQLVKLVYAAKGIASTGVASLTVPTTPVRKNGMAVLEPTSQARNLYQSFINHSVLNRPSKSAIPAVDPSKVSLKIFNGSGRRNFAAETKAVLTSLGYKVTAIGNANPSQITNVKYPPDKQAEAEAIAALFENASITLDSTATSIQLILASNTNLPVAPPPPAGVPPAGSPPPAAAPPATANAPADQPATGTPKLHEGLALGSGPVPLECTNSR